MFFAITHKDANYDDGSMAKEGRGTMGLTLLVDPIKHKIAASRT
jgi:hypothetical protein